MSVNKFRLNNLGEGHLIITIFVDVDHFDGKDVNCNSG